MRFLKNKMENENYLGLLEKSLSKFDYLFQEGVIFDKSEIEKVKLYLEQYNKILNDWIFKSKWKIKL